MHTSSRIGWLFGVGVPLLIVALILQTITLASQDYRTVLIVALLLTLAADICFATAFIRGRIAARCASVILMLPTLFVVVDFVRRAPHSFS
jgi:F0F1-type ATP synthase assembly protein I